MTPQQAAEVVRTSHLFDGTSKAKGDDVRALFKIHNELAKEFKHPQEFGYACGGCVARVLSRIKNIAKKIQDGN